MQRPSQTDSLLARAVELHRAGDFRQAIPIYEAIVGNQPRFVTALNLLGLAYFQSGRADRAVEPLQNALRLEPSLSSGHYNIGRVFQELKRNDDALRSYQKALARQPNDAELHNNLGTVLNDLGRTDEAAACFKKAATLRPDYADAHFNLGNSYFRLRQNVDACAAFQRSADLNPHRCETQCNWGKALLARERFEDALACFDRAIKIDFENSEAHFQRGAALDGLKRHLEARASYELAFSPGRPDVESQLRNGNALMKLQRFDEAIAIYRHLLDGSPDNVGARYNLSLALQEQERLEDAIESYSTALAADPSNSHCLWNRALIDLTLGHFNRGWSALEHRWKARMLEKPEFSLPEWEGRYVDGTLLVWGEQGLGDQIIYASMLDDLRRYAKCISLEIEPRLVSLFARSMPDIEVRPLGQTNLDGITAQVSLADLGRYLRPDWASFGRRPTGYLTAEPAQVAGFRERLAGGGSHVIGVSWHSRNSAAYLAKTATLLDFEPLLRLDNCRFVDLQYGNTDADRTEVALETGVQVERLADVDTFNDIDGLAALISACDAVVTVSNTTAHLAGALGQRTWVMSPPGTGGIWYWFRGKRLSPWYSKLTVHPRLSGQSWTDMTTNFASELREYLNSK